MEDVMHYYMDRDGRVYGPLHQPQVDNANHYSYGIATQEKNMDSVKGMRYRDKSFPESPHYNGLVELEGVHNEGCTDELVIYKPVDAPFVGDTRYAVPTATFFKRFEKVEDQPIKVGDVLLKDGYSRHYVVMNIYSDTNSARVVDMYFNEVYLNLPIVQGWLRTEYKVPVLAKGQEFGIDGDGFLGGILSGHGPFEWGLHLRDGRIYSKLSDIHVELPCPTREED